MENLFLTWEYVRYQVCTLAMAIFARLTFLAVTANRHRSFKENCSAMFIGLFCGVLSGLLVHPLDIPDTTKYSLVGMATFFGVDSILFIAAYLMGKAGMNVSATLKDMNELYKSLNSHAQPAEHVPPQEDLLKTLKGTGRISDQEYLALLGADEGVLSELVRSSRITVVECATILNSGEFNGRHQ